MTKKVSKKDKDTTDAEETASDNEVGSVRFEDPILNKKYIAEVVVHWRAAVPALVVDVKDRRQFIMDTEFGTNSLGFNLVTWNGDSGLAHVPPGAAQERAIGNPQETQHPSR